MCKRYHPSVTYPTKNQSETTDVRATTRRDADIDIEGASAPAILVVDLDMLMVNLWVKPLLPLVVKPYYSKGRHNSSRGLAEPQQYNGFPGMDRDYASMMRFIVDRKITRN